MCHRPPSRGRDEPLALTLLPLSFEAGRLKTLRVEGDNILLGTPFTFTKDNVNRFDF